MRLPVNLAIVAYMKRRLIDAALKLARDGFPVFPIHSVDSGGCTCGDSKCSNAGKHPRTAHGFKDATTDRVTLRKWWRQWPNSNIGIATGTTSGLIVLDIDSRHDGLVSLSELELRHGRLQKSHRVRTGGGGQHLYFKAPTVPIKSKSGVATGSMYAAMVVTSLLHQVATKLETVMNG